MTSRLNPYISFKDNARQAMEFYKSVFGGDLTLSTFGEYGQEGEGSDGIMHAQLETPSGFTLMAADTPPQMEYRTGSSITVSLSGDDESDLKGWWDGLADGGTVQMPLEKQMWGDTFGMLTDKYGVDWMVNIAGGDNAGGGQG
ncbi:VOC family protein [Intrasporangium sp. YIM S08009]|uniref:VOC family protein n=1 Tax=Intrasporangium zincisolvens TaxID=3080018 RepID=UPI002B05B57A|nr:VOC family protein [Intrasporangium sp. YIM S08009]